MLSAAYPRVWLVGASLPADVTDVRDDQGRDWHRGPDGLFRDLSGRHRLSPAELTARTDLVERTGEQDGGEAGI